MSTTTRAPLARATATEYTAFPAGAPGGEREAIRSAITQIMSVLTPLIARQRQTVQVLSQSREDNTFEQRVLDLLNAERARYGLGALSYNANLDLAAERHNTQQAAARTMAHSGIGDASPGDRIVAAGFRNAWGENVAVGQTSPEQVVAEWMASPTHRANILDRTFTKLGVSYTTAADGRPFWAQSFGR